MCYSFCDWRIKYVTLKLLHFEMPFYRRNPSYQQVSWGGEVSGETESYLEDMKKESLMNQRLQPEEKHAKGIKECLLRKISIFFDIKRTLWNNLHTTKLRSDSIITNRKPYCGIEDRSVEKGGVDYNGFNKIKKEVFFEWLYQAIQ